MINTKPVDLRDGQRLGVGIIGLGMVGPTHAHALKDLSDSIEVRGVFARNAEHAAAFGREFGFPVAVSLAAMLADEATQAILLLTPPNARLEIVEACAKAGKHILMEKPVERTLPAARQIVEICEAAGVTLGIVLQHRFRAASRQLKRLIFEKTFGEIRLVQVQVPWWRPQSYYDEPGRGTYARDGGGVLISQAIHTLDLLLDLAGPVSEVQALVATTGLHRMESENFVAGGLRFASGAVGSLMATTSAYPGGAESIVIGFDKASVRLQAGVLVIDRLDGTSERLGEEAGTGGGANPMAFTHAWHRETIADFAEALRQGRPPAITGREALQSHALIEALLRSGAERRAVAVEK